MTDAVASDDLNKARLNHETAKIPWRELQRYFAAGMLLKVSEELDILEVGHRMSVDDKIQIEAWLNEGQLGQVDDDQAQEWFACNAELWALVIRPWVLVQDKAL